IASPSPLFGIACSLCPVEDCPDRLVPNRACDQVELQSTSTAALTHLSPQLPALLNELDDFRIPSRFPQLPIIPLPGYVPQVEPASRLVSRMPRVVALTLSEFVSRHGRSYRGGIRKAQWLRSQGASTVVLVGTSSDQQLEAVWKTRSSFLDAVRLAGIDLVLGPAFSIYLNRPPLERVANRARSLAMCRYLNESS